MVNGEVAMKGIARIAVVVIVAAGLAGCAVYAPPPAPVAYGPAPAYYYGPPVGVGVGVYGGWRGGWHRWS